jgi:hypothetical protein
MITSLESRIEKVIPVEKEVPVENKIEEIVG